nr:unnamed protein product [Naegleria fowleri]
MFSSSKQGARCSLQRLCQKAHRYPNTTTAIYRGYHLNHCLFSSSENITPSDDASNNSAPTRSGSARKKRFISMISSEEDEPASSSQGATLASSTPSSSAESTNNNPTTTAGSSRKSSISARSKVHSSSIAENNLQAPATRNGVFRYAIPWQDADYYNEQKLENEMRRIFEICHGCRRCFNLCDSFPTLFDLIDKVEVLENVPSSEFKKVVDKCTLCDLCYNNKCPYVPPHEFNIDFPHLLLRYRAVEQRKKNEKHVTSQPPIQLKETVGFLNQGVPQKKEFEAPVHDGVDRTLTLQKESELSQQLLTHMDRNGKILTRLPTAITNLMMNNSLVRWFLDTIGLIHKKAYLPPFTFGTLIEKLKKKHQFMESAVGTTAAIDEKVILYTTCLGNYNKPELVETAKFVLLRNGVEVVVDYKQCCGMPFFEQGDLASVSHAAETVSNYLVSNYISKGYKVVTVVPSCSLMLKAEWANILPNNENVQLVKKNTMDISEYVVYLAKKNGGQLPTQDQIQSLPYSVTLHHACHARAQNIGNKGHEMLKFIPGINVSVIQKCSGHGGSFGTKKEHFDTAVKYGKPVAKKILQDSEKSNEHRHIVASECPLAAEHLSQVTSMSKEEKEGLVTTVSSQGDLHQIENKHPIEILAQAYGYVRK